MHKYLAEAVGTLVLSLAVMGALTTTLPLAAPILAALTVCLFVYTIGPISGCHINPAVTLSALSLRLISTKDAIGYIVAQALGAGIAFFIGMFVFTEIPSAPVTDAKFMVLLSEAAGAFLLTFGIAAVVFEKVPPAASGLVIGGSLLLGIMLASAMGSSGILNPAVAFALDSFNALYLFGPIFGGVAGMWAYRMLSMERI